jgi:hypothetical protein
MAVGYVANGGRVAYYAAPRPAAAWPHSVGALPSRADCFHDRAEAARLRQALTAGGTAAVRSTGQTPSGGVLAGLGGVGKTQLAAEYARALWQAGELDVLVWITATDRSAVVSGYAQAATELLTADLADAEAAAQAFLAWLEPAPQRAACRWLIVLDDVADPGDLRRLWPPTSPHGRTLITTRRKDSSLTTSDRPMIEVGVFSAADSVGYLTQVLATRHRREPVGQLAALADDLGHLPLALSQAAAYLVDARISCARYRKLLGKRSNSLAGLAPSSLPDHQFRPVAATWGLSIERADSLSPVGSARQVLQLAAFLDPNGIPDTVLAAPSVLAHITSHRSGVSPTQWVTADQVHLAVRALHRLSLVTHTPETPHQALRVHQLVQRTVRDTLTPAEHAWRARIAADALTAAWPEIEKDDRYAQSLRANATALAACAEEALYRARAHPVLFRLGRSLGEARQFEAAHDHFQHLAYAARRILGADHRDTLAARQKACAWHVRSGNLPGATALLTDLLADQNRALGPDDADTLNTRRMLIIVRRQEGKDLTEELEELALRVGEQMDTLGPDHRDVLDTQRTIAAMFAQTGRKDIAVHLLSELLERQEQFLGAGDPDTRATREVLAFWQDRVRVRETDGTAEALLEVLHRQEQVLGPDHRDVFVTRRALTTLTGLTGDVAGAVGALTTLLRDEQEALGADDPAVFETRSQLAFWEGHLHGAGRAVHSLTDLLRDEVEVFGPRHVETLATRKELAFWQGHGISVGGAVTALAELLGDTARVLGPDHSDIAQILSDLDSWQRQMRSNRAVVTANTELRDLLVSLLGPDHPRTVDAEHQLTTAREKSGDPAAPVEALVKLLDDLLLTPGPDHPLTSEVQRRLAFWRE